MSSSIHRPNPSFVIGALALLLAGFSVSTATAQLSQLEFDQRRDGADVTQPVPENVLNSILAGKKFVQPAKVSKGYRRAQLAHRHPLHKQPKQDQSNAAQSASGKQPQAPKNKGLRTEKIELEQDSRYIIPRVKGPFTDRTDSSRITTELFWKHPNKESCGSVTSVEALQQKSGAIKELLYRFTGNNDYFEQQAAVCTDHCIADVEKSLLSGVALFTGDSSSFEIVRLKGNCHYQLAKPAEADWHPLDGTKAACTCIPK